MHKVRKMAILLLGAVIFIAAQAGSVLAKASETAIDEQVAKLDHVGYKYGGSTVKGFDCSGFTSYVFKQLGIELPRTSKGQATAGVKIAKTDLRHGDLVFFNTSGKGISHVGIYLGDGKFAHSASGKGVTINKLSEKYYANRYVTARRVLSEEAYQKLMNPEIDKLVASN